MCCKVTMVTAEGGRRFGMYLSAEEKKLFPEELVVPLFGAGEPVQPVAYQLAVDRCPHYQEEGGLGSCAIYDRRPLVCRAFPVTSRATVSPHCPSVRAASQDGLDADSLAPELQAHDEKIRVAADGPVPEWGKAVNEVAWQRLRPKV